MSGVRYPEGTGHELVRIRSGALAVRSREVAEVMHPGVGPVAEAEALYVRQSRLAERLREGGAPLVLYDVGLGAGSNALAAWATAEAAPESSRRLVMISFERDLGALTLALTEGASFGFTAEAVTAAQALLTTGQHETARTSWQLRPGDLRAALSIEPTQADIVFWDPFSPRANPELWTVAAFAAVRARAAPGATLFTYSASTAVRAALLLTGWAVGVGDAIGDKAETTAAAVRADDLARPLDATWLKRLGLPGAPWPVDAPAGAFDLVRALPQFSG
ncbi:MAG TPA: MnmC family methyltransferase [Polyangia bacterium]